MKDYTETITRVIKELGIPASLLGYHYIRYAVELVTKDFALMDTICKSLYPSVAKQFNTTASRAERAIRHAISVGWNRGNKDLVMKLFGYSVCPDRGQPTNGEFIATVADYILMQKRFEKRG